MRFVTGFFRFWHDFVIGDDWRIALGVVATLALGAVLLRQTIGHAWLVPIAACPLISGGLVLSLRRATSTGRQRDGGGDQRSGELPDVGTGAGTASRHCQDQGPRRSQGSQQHPGERIDDHGGER
jgi:hypothetical protein